MKQYYFEGQFKNKQFPLIYDKVLKIEWLDKNFVTI